MKTLSIKQPYAHKIITGEKTLEVRGWKTDYRGELAIHVSKRDAVIGLPKEMPRGAIIGVVDLIDVRVMKKKDRKAACLPRDYAIPDDKDTFVFVLANPRGILNPIPYRGTTYLFEPESKVIKALRDRLRRSSGTNRP